MLPVSGVMPSMSKDFKNGVELGLANDSGLEIEIIPELINQGQIQNVSNAINKLCSYHDVDILTGIVSSLAIRELLDTINAKRIPFIFNNVGEYVPSKRIDSPYLFHNSLHLWRSQWAMGKWAQEQYGGTPAICFSIYDGGYHLHEAFRIGTLAGGASTARINMLPLVPNQVDTSALIQLIEQQKPAHVHAVLCGVDGKDFIKRYKEAGFLGKIPLTACPFLVEDGLTADIEGLVNDIPNSISWSYTLKSIENEAFIDVYEKSYIRKPSVFSVLGYESGLAIIHALSTAEAESIALEKILADTRIRGPRGMVVLGNTSASDEVGVYIRKPYIEEKSPVNKVISTLQSVNREDTQMTLVAENGISGWQNPYLCI